MSTYSKQIGHEENEEGRMYEAHVANTLRSEGWIVEENGRLGIYDHGIDLIAHQNGIDRYIQCKGWSPKRLIHDSVVSQLLGSVADRVGLENLKNVEIYIYSSSFLDEYARGEAERLNVHFAHLPYPAKWYHPQRYYKHFHRKRRQYTPR
jgi:hypothetical protein